MSEKKILIFAKVKIVFAEYSCLTLLISGIMSR